MSLTLRNKLLAASIAAAASYLWWSGESPVLPPTSAKASPRPVPALAHPLDIIDPPSPPPQPPPSTPAPATVDLIRSVPRDHPSRPDPFAYATSPSLEPVTEPRSTNSPLAALKLQAISMNNSNGLAVINRRVVAVGEIIDGWRVEGIEPGRVRLRGTIHLETADLQFDRPSPAAH